jgi:hypothetical protein
MELERQYFARLDENNKVIDIAVVLESFLQANPERYEGRWVETFFQHENKTYAGIGYIYNEVEDNFYDPYAITDPDPEKRFS